MTETGAEPEAWQYLAVVVPIVSLFGPVGAFLSSYCHRQVLASFIYILDTLALVRFLSIFAVSDPSLKVIYIYRRFLCRCRISLL